MHQTALIKTNNKVDTYTIHVYIGRATTDLKVNFDPDSSIEVNPKMDAYFPQALAWE